MRKNTIAFDFDNVIHKYRKGWADGTIYDKMNEDMEALMFALLNDGHPVFILSTRDAKEIADHMNNLRLPHLKFEVFTDKFWNRTDVVGVCNHKAVFDVMLDDRAINFNPRAHNVNDLLQQLINFKPKTYK